MSWRPSGRTAHLLAAAICALSLAIAAVWALVLPIFLSPDEDSHYDYALTLFTAGRPMRPAENDVGRDTHPTVAYLMRATHARQQRLDTAVPADPGYGTPAYFRALDAGAPHVDRSTIAANRIDPVPYISRLYPIGYYALAAATIGLGDVVTHGSVVGQFFAARFLSVALLISTLAFTWLALLELGLGTRRALLFFACTALLPMTGWMAGYVQPDNLVCALVAPAVYLALRLRRTPGDFRTIAGIGLVLGALMATKQQYFLALYVPIVAMLAVRLPFRLSAPTFGALAWLTAPALAAYEFTMPFLRAAPGGTGVCKIASPLEAARRLGPVHVAHYYLNGVTASLHGAFFPSTGVESFWLSYTAYRNASLTIGTPSVSAVIARLLAPLSIVVALLFATRMLQVARRLVAVARERSWRSAARVATSNVLVNGYLTYFAILAGFEISTGGVIPLQGRYWLPFVSAVWILAVLQAPRALPVRYARALRSLLATLILGYIVVAAAFTFPSLQSRFYGPMRSVDPKSELLGDITARPSGRSFRFSGAAMDLRDAAPADRVVVRIDASTLVATRRVSRPDIECNMEETLLQSGYEADVAAGKLTAGTHTASLLAGTPWSRDLIDTGERATFVVR